MEVDRKPLSRNIEKVAQSLFSDVESREAFLDAIREGQRRITAVAWLSGAKPDGLYETLKKPEWLPEWIDVVADDVRPGKLPAHDEGKIYCLDLSSTFACAPLTEVSIPMHVIVDVCAAPGGKGIVAWRYLHPQLLIGNEVIRKRTAQLISNYKRCSIDPALVTSCDPSLLGSLLESQAEVVIVDAPCSGQSLLLKDMAAPGAFHPATISMNERRQRRILARSARIVTPGGYLLYSTCTFSREENEDNVEWFLKTFPHFKSVLVSSLARYQSEMTLHHAYRLFPQQGVGAGAFCCLFKRADVAPRVKQVTATDVTETIRPIWASSNIDVSSLPAKRRDNAGDRKRGSEGRKGKWGKKWGGRNRD